MESHIYNSLLLMYATMTRLVAWNGMITLSLSPFYQFILPIIHLSSDSSKEKSEYGDVVL